MNDLCAETLFPCFGFGASEDVIDWVQRSARVGFLDAVELLAQRHGQRFSALHSSYTATVSGARSGHLTDTGLP